jgi:hypothetical protein
MNRSNPLVEIHFAFWAVMTVPIGFAGMFFLVPGLMLGTGFTLQAIAMVLFFYVSRLTRFSRAAWLFGLVLHGGALAAAVYYVPRWPTLLGVPLALANLYSLVVLLAYHRLWTEPVETGLLEAQAA